MATLNFGNINLSAGSGGDFSTLPTWSQPGTTAAQGRTALGFGGTVTVAQLNAAGADARSAMYYCSDCLTVNGPGSLVAWCGRTSTWRTLDDCLLATTDFDAWALDFIKNSNSSEIRGTRAGLYCVLDFSNQLIIATGVNSATPRVQASSLRPYLHRRFTTGTNPAGFTREYTPNSIVTYSGETTPYVFAGARKVGFSAVDTGYHARVGLFTITPSTAALQADEEMLVFDKGNVLGAINPGNSSNWFSLIRSGSVNLSGTADTTVAPVVDPLGQNLCVTRKVDAVKMYISETLVGSGTGAATRTEIIPAFIFSNDGTSTTSRIKLADAFCFGYFIP